MPGPFESDEALLSRVRAGDTEALGALYDRHSARVFRALSYLVGDPDEAASLVQEVFLRVLERREQYRPESGSFRTWLFGIARNLAADVLRRAGRERKLLRPLGEEEPARDDPRETTSGAELAEDLERLRSALAGLQPEERELLVLREIEGLSYEEIAAITGEPEGTLRSRLFHSLRKLRRAMGSGGPAR